MLNYKTYSAESSSRRRLQSEQDVKTSAELVVFETNRASSQEIYTVPIGGVRKRAFDLIVSIMALVFVIPILAALWLIVRLESRGPGIFRQSRGGFAGKSFNIYKLRTMTHGQHSPRDALKNGEHITSFGRFLRKSSLDELPQLLNVIKGDMSIVGPRPHAIEHDEELAALDSAYSKRFHARPGITGLAQANRSRGPLKSEKQMRERTAFDVAYVEHWSVINDVKIILRTVWTMFRSDDTDDEKN